MDGKFSLGISLRRTEPALPINRVMFRIVLGDYWLNPHLRMIVIPYFFVLDGNKNAGCRMERETPLKIRPWLSMLDHEMARERNFDPADYL